MAKKTSLKDKELTKLKKVIKQLKEAKKAKRKRRGDKAITQKDKAITQKDKAITQKDKAVAQKDKAVAQKDKAVTRGGGAITQKVSQKVVIGSDVVKNNNEGNVGRSFPQIQFLPQAQTQTLDTQLLREFLLQKNMSPLTRPVEQKTQKTKTFYDLADQYGLGLDNPVTLGVQVPVTEPIEVKVPVSDAFADTDFFDTDTQMENFSIEGSESVNLDTLKKPLEKQGNLDDPIKDPEPINLDTPKKLLIQKEELSDEERLDITPSKPRKKRGPYKKKTKIKTPEENQPLIDEFVERTIYGDLRPLSVPERELIKKNKSVKELVEKAGKGTDKISIREGASILREAGAFDELFNRFS